MSDRQTKRMAKRYREGGAKGRQHRSAGRKSNRKKSEKFRDTAQFPTDLQGITLEAYNEVAGGFLRVTVDATKLTCEYFAVPFSGAAPATPLDSFTLDWKQKVITASSPNFAPHDKAQVPTRPKRRGAGTIRQGWPTHVMA